MMVPAAMSSLLANTAVGLVARDNRRRAASRIECELAAIDELRVDIEAVRERAPACIRGNAARLPDVLPGH
jgi:hypothetical protein